MSNISGNPALIQQLLSNPSLALMSIQQEQKRAAIEEASARALRQIQEMNRLNEIARARHFSAQATHRGASPNFFITGEPVPTMLNNLNLKKVSTAKKNPAVPLEIPTRLNCLSSTESGAVSRQPKVESVSSSKAATNKSNRKQKMLESGFLAVTDEYPIQFPSNFCPNPITDVVVDGSENIGVPHNVHFEQLCLGYVPSFQAAIRLRNGQIVKRIVKGIIQTITDVRGSFVKPWTGTENGWHEVCRNEAERFTLDKLRKVNAAQKAQVHRSQAGELPARSTGPCLRRVSPPDLEIPPAATLEEAYDTSSSNDETELSSQDEEEVDAMAECARPKKQQRRSVVDANTLDALYLLSEAAANLQTVESGINSPDSAS